MASREGRREAFTGEATGQVLSCETGLLPRCRSRSAEEKATSAHDVTACMGRTSRSRRPCARGEVLCTEPGKSHPCPDRQAGPVHEGNSRTMNMYADENSDGVIVPEKRPNKEGLPSAEAVEGRTPPKGNGGETAAVSLGRGPSLHGLRRGQALFVRQLLGYYNPVRILIRVHVHRSAVAFMNRPGLPVRTRMRLPRFRAKNFSTCTRSPTARGSSHASRYVMGRYCLLFSRTRSAPRK